ncbi:hypothetical protein [Mesorhizobium loti]|uniref:hypothetical protein n=1 Tax=Rhizobium loti TaxID=381 RepID=UPI00047DFC6F|nr:hypothetical protein [Mesorhizobium loti]
MLNDSEQWKFKIGAMITHVDHPMPSLVVDRQRGRPKRGPTIEVYGVRSFAHVDAQRDRLILGDYLKPIDDAAWDICILKGLWMVDGPA